jgi:ribonuclease G
MRKQVLVTVDRGETRVAILEKKGSPPSPPAGEATQKRGDGRRRTTKKAPAADQGDWRVAELYIERRGRRSIVGNIYKGRVDNVLSGMEAAFVDIGLEKNGFLHVDEIVLPDVQKKRSARGRRGGPRISDLLKPGQEVIVQATKDPLGTKGARLTMEISIPGRYLVYSPNGEGLGVSRRLPDSERERLRKLASKLNIENGGLIIRTSAHGARKSDMERELDYLFAMYAVLQQRVKSSAAPSMVFQEADLPVRVVRDVFAKEFERALIDNEKQHHRVKSFFERTAPDLAGRVDLYSGKEPLFERMGVEDVYRSTLSRRVDLTAGGYIMIDKAEALTVIDVNTGSYTGRGRGSLEDTITKVNMHAAEEVVRQLRLRDIGGIIVIDFIDMSSSRNRNQVLNTLRRALEEDRTRTYVVEISPLGLVEMTRQNVTEGVREIMTKPCPTCHGEGVVLSEETIAIEVERKLREIKSTSEAFLVQVHPRVAAILIGGGGKPLKELEEETGKHFHFEGSEGIPLDTFRITAEGTRLEIERRALPFMEGEEVFIEIEEPHMYNVDDAIAKIDGYVISISGGGAFVGERKLVRINQVKRTAAYASVVSENGAAVPVVEGAPDESETEPPVAHASEAAVEHAAAPEEAGQVQSNGSGTSTKRRRGRRGGRRRSGRAGASKSKST